MSMTMTLMVFFWSLSLSLKSSILSWPGQGGARAAAARESGREHRPYA